MSYQINVSGHKEGASEEDFAALQAAADAFVETALDRGYTATGSFVDNQGQKSYPAADEQKTGVEDGASQASGVETSPGQTDTSPA